MVNTIIEQEFWKQYLDYDFIEVSNLGRVRTKDRYVKVKGRGKRLIKGRILKQYNNGDDYMYVGFGVDSKRVFIYVHRMVAITYIPNPNNYPQVNHIDNDRANNSVSNLEWCSIQYNNDYRKNFGKSPAQVLGCPVFAVNLETSEVFWFESQHEVARKLGVYVENVNKVIKGKLNKTGGYWFTYADENTVEKVRAKFGDKVAEKVEELMRNES